MTKKSDLLGGSAAFDTFVTTPPVSDRGRAIAEMTGGPLPAHAPATPKAPIGQIAHNPYNPRLSLKAIQSMADSMEQVEQGIITPIAVVTRAAFLAVHPEAESEIGDALYIAIDGNRRLAGARMAGLDNLPIHVDDELARDGDELLKAALIADAQHEDLDHLDQARALARLVEVHGSQRNVARALGKSQGWVSQRLSLLNLSEQLQQQLADGELTVEVARKIAKFPVEEQEAALVSEPAAKPADPPTPSIVAPRHEGGASVTAAASNETPARGSDPTPPAPAAPASTAELPSEYAVITPNNEGDSSAANSAEAPKGSERPASPAQEAEPQARFGKRSGEYGVIAPEGAAAWSKWLGTATVPDISAALTGTLDRSLLLDLVHDLADHLRTTEE